MLMKWALVTATNNDLLLQSCLAASPCVERAQEFHVMRGFESAGKAYNQAIRQSNAPIVVFAHQDIYLPNDWDDQVASAIEKISQVDPNWGVLGVYGIA